MTANAKPRPRLCKPGEDTDNVQTDAEFESLIPPLSTSELAELHRSLDMEGCRDALTVWKDHDILVDGHNRLRHCRQKGYPFNVVDKEFAGREDVKAYIIHAQLGRRNLSPTAESYLRGKRYMETKRQGARKDLTSDQSDHRTTAQRLAEEFQVAEMTIRRDGKFAEAVDGIIANCGAEARNLILSRDLGLTRGVVLRLSKQDAKEQRQFLDELKSTGKKPRKPREKKKPSRTIMIPAQPKQLVSALVKQLKPAELAEVARELAEAMGKQSGQAGESSAADARKRSRRHPRRADE